MGGVADEEGVALAIVRGHLARHVPRRHAAHGELADVGAHGAAEDLGTTLGSVIAELLGVGVERLHVHPVAVDVVGDERAADIGLEDPVQGGRSMGHHGTEIDLDVDAEERL